MGKFYKGRIKKQSASFHLKDDFTGMICKLSTNKKKAKNSLILKEFKHY
jgi:hypothetical protein